MTTMTITRTRRRHHSSLAAAAAAAVSLLLALLVAVATTTTTTTRVTAFQITPPSRQSRIVGSVTTTTPPSLYQTVSPSLAIFTRTTCLAMSDRTVDDDDITTSSALAAAASSSSSRVSSLDYQTQTKTHHHNHHHHHHHQVVEASVPQRRLWNGMVLSSLVLLTLYLLTHSQLEALFALWEYDLGQINNAGESSSSVTKVSVAAEVLLRLPLDALHSYERLVPQNPIFYKACTSGVAYGLGDFVSQVAQGKRLEDIDLPRSARSGAAGFIGHGPLCHYWLTFMETYLDFGGAWWATGIKVTADLTVWSIFLCASYSFIIGMLEFRDPRDVWKDVKATTWPALRSAWRFWPFVHTISFSHAVPMDLKLLWVDVMEIVWVTILSKVANEDKNAARAEEEKEIITTVSFLADHFVAHTGQGNEEAVASSSSTTANDDGGAWGLSMKVLAACWPLIAMWPVLYAGFQIERMLALEV